LHDNSHVLLGKLMHDNGYHTIHDFVAAVPRTVPLFFPLRQVGDDELKRYAIIVSLAEAVLVCPHDMNPTNDQ
jgi:hypothetical protein